MTGKSTIACPICGRPYKFYSHYAGDQSACPSCRAIAETGQGPWEPYGPRFPREPFPRPWEITGRTFYEVS